MEIKQNNTTGNNNMELFIKKNIFIVFWGIQTPNKHTLVLNVLTKLYLLTNHHHTFGISTKLSKEI